MSENPPGMRPSRVLRKLRAGEVVKSVKLNIPDAKMADLASRCGFDALWLCLEHVPATMMQIEQMIMAGKMHDVDSAVRVRRGSYSDLQLPFEMDAAGIIVPHVMSAAEAREIVRMGRFYPVGMRPADSGNADGAYAMMDFAEYCREHNEQRFIHVQIEDVEAMGELEDIAKVQGVDGLFFGPGDFSQSLGVPGQLDDPRIAAARQQVADAAKRHGKVAATTCSMEKIESYLAMGYRYLHITADVVLLGRQFQACVKDFDAAAARAGYSTNSAGSGS